MREQHSAAMETCKGRRWLWRASSSIRANLIQASVEDNKSSENQTNREASVDNHRLAACEQSYRLEPNRLLCRARSSSSLRHQRGRLGLVDAKSMTMLIGRRRNSKSSFKQNCLLTCLLLIGWLEVSNSDRANLIQFAQAQTSLLSSIYLPSVSSSSAAVVSSEPVVSVGQAQQQAANSTTTLSKQQQQQTLVSGALHRRDLSAAFNSPPSPFALTLNSADFHQTGPNAGGSRRHQSANSNVCQVDHGESVAIVEIVESRGSDMSQSTYPIELPISGSPQRGEIELRIESETHKYFQIKDKQLRLTRPLDRDAILKENSSQILHQPITSIYLQISCLDKRQLPKEQQQAAAKKVIIPVLVKVLDLNDNAPKFSAPIYHVQVNELTPIDSIIFDQIQAIDLDSANNGNIEYSLLWAPLDSNKEPQTLRSTLAAATTTPRPPRLIQREQPKVERPQTVTEQTSSTGAPTSTTVAALAQTTLASAASSSGGAPTRSSGAEPTINLNSEPILNGPMEEGEDEESDESLLASMLNSTIVDGDSEAEFTGLQLAAGRRGKRRKRRHSRQELQTAASASKRATRADLWTDLMASGSAVDDWPAPSGGMSAAERELAAGSLARESLDFFVLEMAPSGSHNGSSRPVIKLKRQLDYETRRLHVLTVVASDRASDKADRHTSNATLIVRVLDGDDQGPAFVLDQGGCATGSLPQPTPASLHLAPTDELRGRRHQMGVLEEPLLSDESVAGAQAGRPPSGFRVTDENFDFSDVSSGDEHNPSSLPGAPTTTAATAAAATTDFAQDPAGRLIVPEGEPVGGQPALFVAPHHLNERPTTNRPTTPASLRPMRGVPAADYSCLQSGASGGSGQAEYFATVMSGDSDYLLRIAPQAIKARDRDELNAPIRYSFVNGTPTNYSAYFQINPIEASVKQIAPIEATSFGSKSSLKFVIWVMAEEQTANKLASLAKLTIEVVPSDKTPPVLVPNSYSGFVEENAPVGTSVLIHDNQQQRPVDGKNSSLSSLMRIQVINGDGELASLRANSGQTYEFETTSDSFKVNKDGYLYVNKWPLDRDPPNQAVHRFQVTARQIGLASSRSLSSPVSINVTLLDLNDNPPVLVNSSLERAQIIATNQPASRQRVSQIRALDADSAENARVHFSLLHVSNGGRYRFKVNEDSGELEALGRFQAGEQFSLTLQAADDLGRSSQGILEVQVAPGPNTGGPQFIVTPPTSLTGDASSLEVASSTGGQLDNSRGYSVEVSEGVAPHTPILQVRAADPENDPISYSIIDGNINNDFYISSKSGQIYVNNKLDREEIGAYRLMVQARDSGGLATNRPVHITVADINDSNPQFDLTQYVFQVEEGVARDANGGPLLVGRVQAHDPDAGDNGKLSYQLVAGGEQSSGGQTLFSVDERSGDIRCMEALDYERAKSHKLLVMAKDGGEQPRSSTASVLIRVIDIQDESPYFERYFIETKVVENQADFKLGQVQAIDPDSVAQISYTLKLGDASLFAVDPQTGVITTKRGLDYEETRQHTLLVGTLEHQETDDLAEVARLLAGSLGHHVALDRSPICRVDVQVLDANDETPQFVNGQPLPVRVQDSVPLGSQVAQLRAEDKDASEPNNQIRYELITAAGQPACSEFFMVDANSGQVSVKSDLRRTSNSECHLQLMARDIGQPTSLSSQVTLTVFIDHIAEISPATQLGFADTHFTVELEENAAPNSLVKLLPIINKPKDFNYPMSCEILSGQEQLGNKFYVTENEQRDCELRTAPANMAYNQPQLPATNSIDYEQKQRYTLTLRLNTVGSQNQKSLCQVQVNIMDKNDNRPKFQQPARYSTLTQGRYLAAIANDSPSETQVIQIRATDEDSLPFNGLISYELLNGHELEGRFKIEPIDGVVRTARPVEDVPQTRLPMRLKVMARDHPEVASESLESTADIVVNLIEDRHRIALVLKDTPTGRVLDAKEDLLSTIQERTGMISGLEKVEALKVQRNGTIESDVSGSDFWFYLIEPGTLRIVTSDDPRLRSALFEHRAQSSLLDVISQTLGFNKAKVRLPYGNSSASGRTSGSSTVARLRALTSGDNLASLLIVGGLSIALISAIVLIYQCGSWSSYSRASKEKFYLQQQQQQQHLVASLYPPGFGGRPLDSSYAPFHSAFSTLANPHSLATGKTLNGSDPMYQLEPSIVANAAAAAGSTFLGNKQEYETQMLKMSVMFDDSNSLDDQNLQDNQQVNSKTLI